MNEEKRTPKPLTNGDRLRAMSNEELAEIFYDGEVCPTAIPLNSPCRNGKPVTAKTCKKCCLDWLNSPAESEVNHE